jgi:DNA-binding transcriptional LysR family regulator
MLINWLVVNEPDLTPGPAIDRQVRVVAVSHPLARRETVSVEDLAGQSVARVPVPCHNSHTGSELVFSVFVRLLSGTR